jgi:hypothetical protein
MFQELHLHHEFLINLLCFALLIINVLQQWEVHLQPCVCTLNISTKLMYGALELCCTCIYIYMYQIYHQNWSKFCRNYCRFRKSHHGDYIHVWSKWVQHLDPVLLTLLCCSKITCDPINCARHRTVIFFFCLLLITPCNMPETMLEIMLVSN